MMFLFETCECLGSLVLTIKYKNKSKINCQIKIRKLNSQYNNVGHNTLKRPNEIFSHQFLWLKKQLSY